MSFLDEIAFHLEQTGAAVLGESLFLSAKANIPVGDGPYATIIESGGMASRRNQNGTATQRPAAQIMVRASSYPVARAMAVDIYNALGGDNGMYNVIIDGTFYQQLVTVQQVTDLGLDELMRARLVFNINAEKVPS
jgi:hypothetical protein